MSLIPYKHQLCFGAYAVTTHMVFKLHISTFCLIRADVFPLQYEIIVEFEITVLKSMEPMLRCTDGEYILFHRAAYVALQPKWNSWSRSTGSSLGDIFISNSRSTSICIVFLLFERYSYSLYTLSMKSSTSFSTALGNFKKTKKILTNLIEAKKGISDQS